MSILLYDNLVKNTYTIDLYGIDFFRQDEGKPNYKWQVNNEPSDFNTSMEIPFAYAYSTKKWYAFNNGDYVQTTDQSFPKEQGDLVSELPRDFGLNVLLIYNGVTYESDGIKWKESNQCPYLHVKCLRQRPYSTYGKYSGMTVYDKNWEPLNLVTTTLQADDEYYVTYKDNHYYQGNNDQLAVSNTTIVLDIPNHKLIKEYGENCFKNMVVDKDVVFPSGLKTLGQYAFSTFSAHTVTFNDNLVTIGAYAFENSQFGEGLDYVLSETVKTVGNNAFRGTKFNSITIPDTVTSFGKNVCAVSNIREARIPTWITDIPDSTFDTDNYLSAITMCDRPTSIGKNAFLANKFEYLPFSDTSALNSIGDYAFNQCSKLKEITFEKATTLGIYAFANCTSLSSVTLHNGQTSLPNYCFRSTPMSEIDLKNINTLGEGVFYECSGLTSINLSNITTMSSSYCFYNCSALTSIVLPSAITTIPNNTFNGCKHLAITDWKNVTSLGENAFRSNEYGFIEGVNTDNITTLGPGALRYGTFSKLYLPKNVTSIGNSCFRECPNLTYIEVSGDVPTTMGTNVFTAIPTNGTLALVAQNVGQPNSNESEWRTWMQTYLPSGWTLTYAYQSGSGEMD